MKMNEASTRSEIVRANYEAGKSNMIRKLFALAYGMQWDCIRTPDEHRLVKSQRVKKHLNEWFLGNEHSPVKEPIDKMTYKQLTVAVTVMENLRKNFLSKI